MNSQQIVEFELDRGAGRDSWSVKMHVAEDNSAAVEASIPNVWTPGTFDLPEMYFDATPNAEELLDALEVELERINDNASE